MSDEFEFVIGGRTYAVRPTLKLVRRVENIGAPVAFARRLSAGESGIIETAAYLYAILRDIGGPEIEKLQEMLFEEGIPQVRDPMVEMMVRLWVGNKRQAEEAEKKAGEERPPTVN